MNFETKATAALSGVVDILKHVTGMHEGRESLGERVFQDDQVKAFACGKQGRARIELTSMEMKTAIIGDGTQNNPLAPTITRHDVHPGARRKLFVRDLMSQGTTTEGAVEYPIENVYTDTADSQNRENTAFTESGSTFTLSFQPVETIGHYVTVSRQILSDSGVLDAYLRNTLLYGLELEIENQIVNSDGTNSELAGLLDNATAYTVQSPQLTNEVDIVREIIKQLQVADFSPDAIILNPVDWYSIDVRKVGSSDDRYVGGNPREMSVAPSLWGLPVVLTNSIASGTCLVGDFQRAAVIFDRQNVTIEMSRKHSDNMTKNMVTMLATARVSMVVAKALGIVKATI